MKRNVAPENRRAEGAKIREIPEERICRAIERKMRCGGLSITRAIKSCAGTDVGSFRKYATAYLRYTREKIVRLNNELRDAEEVFLELNTLTKSFPPSKKDSNVPLFAVIRTVTPIATPGELPRNNQQMEKERPWWTPKGGDEVREILSALPSKLQQRLKMDLTNFPLENACSS